MQITREQGSEGFDEAIDILQQVAARGSDKPNGYILIYIPEKMTDDGGESDIEIISNFPVHVCAAVLDKVSEDMNDAADEDPMDALVQSVIEGMQKSKPDDTATKDELPELSPSLKSALGLILISALLNGSI